MSEQPSPELVEALREQIKKKAIQLAEASADIGLVPLRIACVMTSCRHGRHCLDHIRRPRGNGPATDPGVCRDCEQHVVDLPGPGGRHYGDVEELIGTCLDQQNELIRAHYWRVPIDRWASNQARRLGMKELRERTAKRVTAVLVEPGPFAGRTASYSKDIIAQGYSSDRTWAPLKSGDPNAMCSLARTTTASCGWSGQMNTPVIAYAQHATATCCLRCAGYWHGFPDSPDQTPTPAQLHHAITVAVAYLKLRLPSIPEDRESGVQPIRLKFLPTVEEDAAADDPLMEALASRGDPAGLLMPARTTLQLSDTRGEILIARKMPIHQLGA